jgi:D-alanyl-D-alanine carboxypeptidase
MPKPIFAVFRVLLALLLIVLAWATWSFSTTLERVAFEGEAAGFDEWVERWAALDEVPGAILYITRRGAVEHAFAAGRTEREGGDPLTIDTPFHIASVGKLFTAVTVLRLAERGELDLDAPVARWLPPEVLRGLVVVDGVDYGEAITARQLLTHRAGLGNSDDDLGFQLTLLLRPGRRWTPDDLLARAREIDAVGRPGARNRYASPGYWLLGRLIERVSDAPYHETVRREVLEPLGMTSTFESTQEWEGDTPVLHHYAGRFDLTRNHPSFEYADGGFVSTAHDLARFGQALLDGSVFQRPETARLLVAPWPGETRNDLFQAHGPMVMDREDGPRQWFHAGYWGVYLVVLPDADRVAVVALGQSTASAWTFWRQAMAWLDVGRPRGHRRATER